MTAAADSYFVIHVTDAFFPETGGVERVVENLTREQARRNYRVAVLTKGLDGAPGFEPHGDVNVFRYPHRQRPTPLNYLTSVSGGAKTLNVILADRKPDLLHCHLTLASQGPLHVAKKLGIPVVAGFYGPWDKEFAVEAMSTPAAKKILYERYLKTQMAMQRWMQRRLLSQAARVIVLSDYSIGQAEQLCPGVSAKIVKVPGGVETDRFYPENPTYDLRAKCNISEEPFLILTVRRLVFRMGVDLLIDATARLIRQGKKVHLAIGGKGPLHKQLEQQVEAAGLKGHVTFLGFVAEQHLPDCYRSADLFVMPTRAEENFGLPILESAACATPVVGTPSGSIPEVLGTVNSDWVTKNVSAEAIAQKILWIMENYDTIHHQAKEKAMGIREEFSWSAITRKIEKVYREVLS